MSRSTPRPTMPSAAMSMDSSAAPFSVTVAAATPLYSMLSKTTWHRASMWLSALPWIFIAIRSMLNASPGPTSAPSGRFIPCWAGSGLSAAGWCSTGAASETVRPSVTSPTAARTSAGVM